MSAPNSNSSLPYNSKSHPLQVIRTNEFNNICTKLIASKNYPIPDPSSLESSSSSDYSLKMTDILSLVDSNLLLAELAVSRLERNVKDRTLGNVTTTSISISNSNSDPSSPQQPQTIASMISKNLQDYSIHTKTITQYCKILSGSSPPLNKTTVLRPSTSTEASHWKTIASEIMKTIIPPKEKKPSDDDDDKYNESSTLTLTDLQITSNLGLRLKKALKGREEILIHQAERRKHIMTSDSAAASSKTSASNAGRVSASSANTAKRSAMSSALFTSLPASPNTNSTQRFQPNRTASLFGRSEAIQAQHNTQAPTPTPHNAFPEAPMLMPPSLPNPVPVHRQNFPLPPPPFKSAPPNNSSLQPYSIPQQHHPSKPYVFTGYAAQAYGGGGGSGGGGGDSNNAMLRRRGPVSMDVPTTDTTNDDDHQLSQQKQQAHRKKPINKNRTEDLALIESSIASLTGLFSQMSSLVSIQGEEITKIEDDVEVSLLNVEYGESEIFKTQEITKGNRALIVKVFLVLAGLICVFRFIK